MSSFLKPLIEGTAGRYYLKNQRTGASVADHVITAFDPESRRTGLLKRSHLPVGSALIIAPTNAVHTFFMKFAIDLAFVTKKGEVVKTRTALGPWRMSGALRAYAVIELSAGALRLSDTKSGDTILLAPRAKAGGERVPA